jgi:hypothetical protein
LKKVLVLHPFSNKKFVAFYLVLKLEQAQAKVWQLFKNCISLQPCNKKAGYFTTKLWLETERKKTVL